MNRPTTTTQRLARRIAEGIVASKHARELATLYARLYLVESLTRPTPTTTPEA